MMLWFLGVIDTPKKSSTHPRLPYFILNPQLFLMYMFCQISLQICSFMSKGVVLLGLWMVSLQKFPANSVWHIIISNGAASLEMIEW